MANLKHSVCYRTGVSQLGRFPAWLIVIGPFHKLTPEKKCWLLGASRRFLS